MNLNFELAREIYGLTPWFMDAHSIPVMNMILQNAKNGVSLEESEFKLNSPQFIDCSGDTRVISRPFGNGWNPGQLDNKEDFKGIGLINLDGPITRSGGASSRGMEQLSSFMLSMAEDDRVTDFIVYGNSGGGSSAAVELMVDTIRLVNKTKPVHGLVKKGGMSASACYGIMSACKTLHAESEMSIIGSCGTMLQFEGYAANKEDSTGKKHIRLYATKSVKKNQGVEEALNNSNYEILVNDLLDPMNENFLNTIRDNRAALKNVDFDNGATYFAKDVVGTFIDSIVSFDELIDQINTNSVGSGPISEEEVTGEEQDSNSNNNLIDNTMKKSEIESKFPDAASQIKAEGVEAERERVKSWSAWATVDPKGSQAGIESGKNITSSEREVFFQKQNAQQTIEKLKSSSNPNVVVADPKNLTQEEIDQATKIKEVESAFDFEIED